jgi:hypothetical protein
MTLCHHLPLDWAELTVTSYRETRFVRDIVVCRYGAILRLVT